MWALPCVPEELIIDTVMTFTLEVSFRWEDNKCACYHAPSVSVIEEQEEIDFTSSGRTRVWLIDNLPCGTIR